MTGGSWENWPRRAGLPAEATEELSFRPKGYFVEGRGNSKAVSDGSSYKIERVRITHHLKGEISCGNVASKQSVTYVSI